MRRARSMVLAVAENEQGEGCAYLPNATESFVVRGRGFRGS